MKTAGLVLVWVVMTVILVCRFADIEDSGSFLMLYITLSIYLGYLAWQNKKERQKNELEVGKE